MAEQIADGTENTSPQLIRDSDLENIDFSQVIGFKHTRGYNIEDGGSFELTMLDGRRFRMRYGENADAGGWGVDVGLLTRLWPAFHPMWYSQSSLPDGWKKSPVSMGCIDIFVKTPQPNRS